MEYIKNSLSFLDVDGHSNEVTRGDTMRVVHPSFCLLIGKCAL